MKVNPSSNSINVHKRLPKSLVIPRAGTHLYSIGLTFYKPSNAGKRNTINNPYFVMILVLISILRQIILLIIPEQNQDFYAIVGDLAYFIGIRCEVSFLIILGISLAFLSQILNYYYYIHGINPIDLRVFAMLSGLI